MRNTCLSLNLVLTLIESLVERRKKKIIKECQRVIIRNKWRRRHAETTISANSRFFAKWTMSHCEPEPRGRQPTSHRLDMLFKCGVQEEEVRRKSRRKGPARKRRVALRYKQLSEVKRGRSARRAPGRVMLYSARLIITQICSSFTGTHIDPPCPRRYTCDTCRACPFSCTLFRSLRCAFRSIQFRRSKKWSMYMSRAVCEIRPVYGVCQSYTIFQSWISWWILCQLFLRENFAESYCVSHWYT